MFQLTKPDEENIWRSILTLSTQAHFKEAKTLIKIVMENTLFYSPFAGLVKQILSINPTSKPIKPDSIKKMKEIDESFRESLHKDDYDQAKLVLIDYVSLSSEVFSDTPEALRKSLLASLISDPESDPSSTTPIESGKEMYSPKDAAEILGLSDQTIRRMCEKGKFPGAMRTMGGHWKIPSEHFKITKEQAQQIDHDLKDIRQKALDGGEVDEFDLVD